MQRLGLAGPDGQPWPAAKVRALHGACERSGLLTSIGESCLWFLPPLVTSEEECAEIAELLNEGFQVLSKQE